MGVGFRQSLAVLFLYHLWIPAVLTVFSRFIFIYSLYTFAIAARVKSRAFDTFVTIFLPFKYCPRPVSATVPATLLLYLLCQQYRTSGCPISTNHTVNDPSILVEESISEYLSIMALNSFEYAAWIKTTEHNLFMTSWLQIIFLNIKYWKLNDRVEKKCQFSSFGLIYKIYKSNM